MVRREAHKQPPALRGNGKYKFLISQILPEAFSRYIMEKLILFRQYQIGTKVVGSLYFKNLKMVIPTIENSEYLAPEGTFPLRLEYSPKFQKHLWELKKVPDRTEIKIHQGYKPEQSRGCILISRGDLHHLNSYLPLNKNYQIEIKNPKT